MKKLSVIPLLCTTAILLLLCTGCDEFSDCLKAEGNRETRTVDLEAIEAFDIFGAYELTIKEGSEQKIEINSFPNLIDELLNDSSVEGKTWHLGISKCVAGLKKSNIKITATINKLSSINISGSGDVKTDGTFNNVEDLDLDVDGSGNINLVLGSNMNNIESDIKGSGDFILSGKAKNHNIKIAGSGDVNAFDLSTNASDIKILGAGNCDVLVEDDLTIKITGSGNLCFKGNPTISSRVTGSGDINDCN